MRTGTVTCIAERCTDLVDSAITFTATQLTVVTCCCLHNITIELSGAGWAWDAGVTRGNRGPPMREHRAKIQVVLRGTTHSTFDRVRDNAEAKALRSRVLELLKDQDLNT